MTKGELIKLLNDSDLGDDTLVLVQSTELEELTADIASVEDDVTPDLDSSDEDAEVDCIFLYLK